MDAPVGPGSQELAIADTATGLIRNNEPGTWSAHSDGSCRTGRWISPVLFYCRLEPLLDGQKIGAFAFRPTFTLHAARARRSAA